MAATVVVMLGRNLEFLFFSCVLSFFITTTFLQLSHFSQELPSGFSNFLDLPAPLPAPSVSPESLIQFRRLRSFAKQLLWDRCFQQLPNSINRACVKLHIAITATGSLDKLVFPVRAVQMQQFVVLAQSRVACSAIGYDRRPFSPLKWRATPPRPSCAKILFLDSTGGLP